MSNPTTYLLKTIPQWDHSLLSWWDSYCHKCASTGTSKNLLLGLRISFCQDIPSQFYNQSIVEIRHPPMPRSPLLFHWNFQPIRSITPKELSKEEWSFDHTDFGREKLDIVQSPKKKKKTPGNCLSSLKYKILINCHLPLHDILTQLT